MDGGSGQAQMSDAIKHRIRQSAAVRREKRLAGRDQHAVFVADEAHPLPDPSRERLAASGIDDVSAAQHATSAFSDAPTLGTSSSDNSPFNTPPAVRLVPLGGPSFSTSLGAPIQAEYSSVMIYLDYVFPFLFPSYRPPLLETGRQWLLGLLCQNQVSFHTAASMSMYFFSLLPQKNGEQMHESCRIIVWNQLVEQMDLALHTIRDDIAALGSQGDNSSVTVKIRIMEEIVQLLIVEDTVRRDVDWRVHLTPALTIFDEIFKTHGLDDTRPSMAVLLSALPPLACPPSAHCKPLPNTADQSALVFFVSLLLFIDIISSTSLAKPPALQSYHDSLLSLRDQDKCPVRLDLVVGCQNWVLVAVGEISALCAWKREASSKGDFSVVELVKLAASISQALEDGLEELAASRGTPPVSNMKKTITSLLEPFNSRHDGVDEDASARTLTRIWARAAQLYLEVTLSGWQAQSSGIQRSVTEIINLLQAIKSPAQLRSLSWPICVAGCLAQPWQEHHFRNIAMILGPLGEFGTLAHALRIIEDVWRSRDGINKAECDIASFLSRLSNPALLI